MKMLAIIVMTMMVLLVSHAKAEDKNMDEAHFAQLLEQASAGDLSTLSASLQEPDSQIGTSKGSKNDAILSYLVEVGMAEKLPLNESLPPALQEKMVSFKIGEEAKLLLLKLLQK